MNGPMLWRATRDLGLIDLMTRGVDPRITFTRASQKSYFDADGVMKFAAANEWPREYDPTTGRCLGRSVLEQRTNLLVRSQEFDSASWASYSPNIAVTPGVFTAPDGTLTGDRVAIISSGSAFAVNPQNASRAAGQYTFSVFAKEGSARYIQLLFGSALTTQYANFDLQTGQVTAGTYDSARCVDVGMGIYRCEVTVTFAAGAGVSAIYGINASNSGRASVFTGAAGSYFDIWGAQLELGGFATSYIQTAAAASTRNADTAIIGTLPSIGYNAVEGTFFASAVAPQGRGPTFTPTIFSLNDGTGSNRVQCRYETTGLLSGGVIISGGVSQAALGPIAAYSPLSELKVATALKADDFAASANGGPVFSDAAGLMPSGVTRIEIGTFVVSQHFNGFIRRLRYIPRRIPNAQLQAMTS